MSLLLVHLWLYPPFGGLTVSLWVLFHHLLWDQSRFCPAGDSEPSRVTMSTRGSAITALHFPCVESCWKILTTEEQS